MNGRVLLFSLVIAGSVAAGGRASAQDVTPQVMPAPAHISVIDGAALLVRDGRAEAATSNMPLLEGDRLRADAGRLEVLLPDGSALYLDQRTTVDLLSAALMRLTDGRMILVVSGRPDERPVLNYQIDAPAGSIHIVRPGEYRVSIVQGTRGPDVELAVVRGEATMATEQDAVAVRAGEHAFASEGLAPSDPQPFNSARVDAFVRWSDDCRNALVSYASRQYLPSEIQVYAGAFDRYGSWDTYQPYGDVWYPTVQADWRPYYDGFWRPLGYYGWTWIGDDPWSWPTHHYGRWGFGARGWFWIPGRSWASAWVSWGLGSSYVSWCPLGWDNRAVFSLNAGINTFGGRGYDPWYGWTAIPRHSFGAATRVAGVAVPRHLLGSPRGRFAEQYAPPPVPAGIAGRPFGAGGRPSVAAGRAVPRGSSGMMGGGQDTVSLPSRAPFGGARSPVQTDTPYDRARAAAGDREYRAPAAGNRAVPRSADWGSRPSSSSIETYRRAPGALRSEPGAASGAPYPPTYRSPVPQGLERRSTAPAVVPRAPERSYSLQPRSTPGAGAVGRRAPTPMTVPQGFERRSTAPAVVPRAPERSYSLQPRSTPGAGAVGRRAPTPMTVPQGFERRSTAPAAMSRAPRVEQRMSAPSGMSSFSRPASPPAVGRSRPQGSPAGQPARSRAPQQGAPRRR